MDRKKAEQNFKQYLNDGLIKKVDFNPLIYDTYLKNSQESLEVANKLFNENNSDLCVIVISYYSQFYLANAYLLKLGYKVSHKIVHKVVSDSLFVLVKNQEIYDFLENYEEEKEEALSLSQSLVENYELERLKRSKFQYETSSSIKRSKAKTSLDRAKQFNFTFRGLLESER